MLYSLYLPWCGDAYIIDHSVIFKQNPLTVKTTTACNESATTILNPLQPNTSGTMDQITTQLQSLPSKVAGDSLVYTHKYCLLILSKYHILLL